MDDQILFYAAQLNSSFLLFIPSPAISCLFSSDLVPVQYQPDLRPQHASGSSSQPLLAGFVHQSGAAAVYFDKYINESHILSN